MTAHSWSHVNCRPVACIPRIQQSKPAGREFDPSDRLLCLCSQTCRILPAPCRVRGRQGVRLWLIRSVLKASGIWGSGLDTLLTALREKISINPQQGFPVVESEIVMALRGKSLTFTDVEIDELCDLPHGDARTFALLSMIFPGFDLSRHFHVDHIYPQGRFTDAQQRKAGLPDNLWNTLQERHNRLRTFSFLKGRSITRSVRRCRMSGTLGPNPGSMTICGAVMRRERFFCDRDCRSTYRDTTAGRLSAGSRRGSVCGFAAEDARRSCSTASAVSWRNAWR